MFQYDQNFGQDDLSRYVLKDSEANYLRGREGERERYVRDRPPPGPCVPYGGTPVATQCPLPSRGDALFSEQWPGIVVVVSCTKLPLPRVYLCASAVA
jgi:hypothetical protein